MDEIDLELDTKGLKCPMPVLKAKKAISRLDAGSLLKIEATDPGAVDDFNAFCQTGGHEMLESSEADGIFTFVLKKTG